MKFTRSKDGIERATVMVPIRLTREAIETLACIAATTGTDWRKALASEVSNELQGALMRWETDQEESREAQFV